MDLTYSHHGTSKHSGNGDGIYISKAKIIGVLDTSGQDQNGRADDLSLQVKLQVEGVDFEPTFYISGNFKRDPRTNEIKSIGGAFKVLKFLTTVLGLERVELQKANGYRLDPNVLQALIGQEFFRLSYKSGTKPDGKAKYSIWSTVAAPDSDPEELRKQFLEERKRTGYPKNYAMPEEQPASPF